MFDGGFGVGLTVAPLDVDAWPVGVAPTGVSARPSRLGEVMPVAARSDAEIGAELQRVQQIEAKLAGYKLELVEGLAARRPDSFDLQPGEPGAASAAWVPGAGNPPAAGVSEFFADELALVLGCSRGAATRLADAAEVLVGRLPDTWAALADGVLDWPRARAMAAELLAPSRDADLPPGVLPAIEAVVLPRAAHLSVPGLQAAVRRELLRHDSSAADKRRERAAKAADVTCRRERDGMATFSVFLPAQHAAEMTAIIDAHARVAKQAGDPRPIGQIRVEVLRDLIRRPGQQPPVSAHVTVLAPLPTLTAAAAHAGEAPHPAGHGCPACHTGRPHTGPAEAGPVEPGEVDGQPITAAQLRAILEDLDALCPGGLQAPTGGSLDIALTDPVSGALRAVLTRAELDRLARRGCPQHPAMDCACELVDRPPPVDRYRPSAALRRFCLTRDRTCRHPGCGNRAGWADLDHVIPHEHGGATSCQNLCCLCRRHHRLKTHAPGWTFAMDDDGTLTVTTPSGVTRTTRPPGSDPPVAAAGGTDDESPPF